MIVVSEQEALDGITLELAFTAVREALIAVVDGTGSVNPIVISPGVGTGETFSIKSGVVRNGQIVGFKVGSYWPGNAARGEPAHSSSILLLDPATGALAAVIQGRALNGFRTAAADAVAAKALARRGSETLALIGAGHQAAYEIRALCDVLPIRRVLIASRSTQHALTLARLITPQLTAIVETTTVEAACRAADVLVTVTTSRLPLFEDAWIRAGTHVATMGSDQVGKQELPIELLRRARLFCDLPDQSVVIGEYQHIRKEVVAGVLKLTTIGDVLSGRAVGRRTPEDITVFDSSGIALQDLFVAAKLLRVTR